MDLCWFFGKNKVMRRGQNDDLRCHLGIWYKISFTGPKRTHSFCTMIVFSAFTHLLFGGYFAHFDGSSLIFLQWYSKKNGTKMILWVEFRFLVVVSPKEPTKYPFNMYKTCFFNCCVSSFLILFCSFLWIRMDVFGISIVRKWH